MDVSFPQRDWPLHFLSSHIMPPIILFAVVFSVPVVGKPCLRVEHVNKTTAISRTSSDLHDCLPPKPLTSRTCTLQSRISSVMEHPVETCRVLPHFTKCCWFHGVEGGVSSLLHPFEDIYKWFLFFLLAMLKFMLIISSPLSLQGVHECKGAEGGPAAEQHPLPQCLLCQFSERRVGWCCHLAMG